LKLPVHGDLFPAVLGPTVLDREFGFVTFSELNGMKWPLAKSIDLLFEMLILTNPFDMGRVFWDVIQEVASAIRSLMSDDGIRQEDIEIDFDSLFPVVMICIFVLGIDEWLQVASYTIAFNEHTADDPQLQFAMTYLEGIITQIVGLDVDNLQRLASELKQQHTRG
jgi:hypothetical protein